MARGLPSSLMVKSCRDRSSMTRPRESLATTSICTTRVSERSVGRVCAAADVTKSRRNAGHRIWLTSDNASRLLDKVDAGDGPRTGTPLIHDLALGIDF